MSTLTRQRNHIKIPEKEYKDIKHKLQLCIKNTEIIKEYSKRQKEASQSIKDVKDANKQLINDIKEFAEAYSIQTLETNTHEFKFFAKEKIKPLNEEIVKNTILEQLKTFNSDTDDPQSFVNNIMGTINRSRKNDEDVIVTMKIIKKKGINNNYNRSRNNIRTKSQNINRSRTKETISITDNDNDSNKTNSDNDSRLSNNDDLNNTETDAETDAETNTEIASNNDYNNDSDYN